MLKAKASTLMTSLARYDFKVASSNSGVWKTTYTARSSSKSLCMSKRHAGLVDLAKTYRGAAHVVVLRRAIWSRCHLVHHPKSQSRS